MTDEAEKLAEDVANFVAGMPSLSDLEEDETLTTDLEWFNHPRRDTSGFAISAVYGTQSRWNDFCEETIEPLLDKRTLRSDGSTTIGTLTFDRDGEVVDWSVKDEFIRSSAKS